MKKAVLIFGCIFLINLTDCFSQLDEKNQKEFISKTIVVSGSSNEFAELYLGITFGKVINSIDTIYYIKFKLFPPKSELMNDISFTKASAINFLSKSGKLVDIKLRDLILTTEQKKQMDDPRHPVTFYYNSMILILNVTKEKLIEIGSEPFYNIIIPFYNISSNIENKAIFWPTLLTRRNFTQKNVQYILEIGM
jgi:hypothetical protein